jgi:8-oxo-dGTP diphosphatase
MKIHNVAAAILIDPDGRIFTARRKSGDYAGYWEFPGGKLEPGETYEQALHREVKEELGVEVTIDSPYHTVDYDYPKFHLHMQCYLCYITTGEITLTDHTESCWLMPTELDSVRWLPADDDVLTCLKSNCIDSGAALNT